MDVFIWFVRIILPLAAGWLVGEGVTEQLHSKALLGLVLGMIDGFLIGKGII